MTTFFKSLLLSPCLLLLNTSMAQTFTPNADGYVSDPKFHQLIQSEGYELVGFFDTLTTRPLLIGAKVLKDGTWNYIDVHGRIIPGMYAERHVQKELEPVVTERYGMDMMNDHVAVPPSDNWNENEKLNPMAGFNMNTSDGKTGLMNSKKVQVLDTKYEKIIQLGPQAAYVSAKLDGLWGAYSLDGKEILPHVFTEIRMTRNASKYPEFAFQAKKDGKIGFYSISGKQTVAPQFDIARESWENDNLIEITVDNKKGMLDKTGKIIIKPKYAQIQPFNKNGFAIAMIPGEKGLYTVVDLKGKERLKPVYEKIEYIGPTLCKVTKGKDESTEVSFFNMRTGELVSGTYASIDEPWEGCSRISQKVKGKTLYGYADTTGKLIVPAVFDYCDPGFRAEMAIVKQDGHTGIIDKKGNWILKTKYEELSLVFPETLHGKSKEKPTRAYYKEKGLLGVIDLKGNVIIPAAYTKMGALSSFYLVRAESSLWGTIDLTGNIVIPIEYETLGKIRDGFFTAKKGGKRYKVDFYGGIIAE